LAQFGDLRLQGVLSRLLDRASDDARRAGAEATVLGGCCGLAGNFGVVEEHRAVSLAVAEQHLLPAVRAADDDALVLADGFSCRTQLADLTQTRGRHLAEVLADALGERLDTDLRSEGGVG
jgi:Fe-S oxidoreductase